MNSNLYLTHRTVTFEILNKTFKIILNTPHSLISKDQYSNLKYVSFLPIISVKVRIRESIHAKGPKNVRNSEIFEIAVFELSSINYKSFLRKNSRDLKFYSR